jgi:hypothetical protein
MVRFIRSVTPTINRIKSSKKSNIFLERGGPMGSHQPPPPHPFHFSGDFFSPAWEKSNKNTLGPHCTMSHFTLYSRIQQDTVILTFYRKENGEHEAEMDAKF